MIWLGIDPGAIRTGLCLREGREVLGGKDGWRVIELAEPESEIGVGPRYFDEITLAADQLSDLAIQHGELTRTVEGVRRPKPFTGQRGKKAFLDPMYPMATAATWAAITARFPDILTVTPNRHGKGMLAGYPEVLITAGERRHGLMREAPDSSAISHAREAWDCTLSAERMRRAA